MDSEFRWTPMLKGIIGLGTLLISLAATPPQSRPASAEQDSSIPAGSKVFTQPIDGFERFLETAILRNKVALVIVRDRKQAAFEITGYLTVYLADPGSELRMDIAIRNTETGTRAFSYSQDIQNSKPGKRSGAESFAKQLKAWMHHSTTD